MRAIIKVFFIIGPAGSGKTTIGKIISKKLNFYFIEGDDFHSKSNILKMRRGRKLNDRDRFPWINILKKHILTKEKNCVVSCSALKKIYRQKLRNGLKVKFILPYTPYRILKKRLVRRKHYFNPKQLFNQYSSFQKKGVVLTFRNRNIDTIVEKILTAL